MSFRRNFRLVVVLIGAVCVFTASALAQMRYTVIDLGEGVTPYLINERGEVVLAGTYQVYRAGQFTSLPLLVQTDTVPCVGCPCGFFPGINNHGDVVGQIFDTDWSVKGALWTKGNLFLLPTLGGPNGSATAINDRGQVTGYADTLVPENDWVGLPWKYRVFRWQNGVIQELPGLSECNSDAWAINQAGQIAGHSDTTCDFVHPFFGRQFHATIWDVDGSVHDLGALGSGWAYGAALNDLGQVIGVSWNGENEIWDGQEVPSFRGFIAEMGKPMVELAPFPGDADSNALAINNKGQVVGVSGEWIWPTRAVLWENGATIDLSTLIDPEWQMIYPMSINNRSEIVGHAVLLTDNTLHGVMLVPEYGEGTPRGRPFVGGKNVPPLPEWMLRMWRGERGLRAPRK